MVSPRGNHAALNRPCQGKIFPNIKIHAPLFPPLCRVRWQGPFEPPENGVDGLDYKEPPIISKDTEACLECHLTVYPGILADWEKSRLARFTSAVPGADYGVFANGRWYLSKNIRDMLDRIHLHERR